MTLAIFGPALAGPYIWDDAWQVEQNLTLRSAAGLVRLLTTDTCESAGHEACVLYHPLPMASLWLQAQATGLSMIGFRLGNLVIHWFAAWLLYQFLRRQGLARPPSLAAVSLFLVHPSVTEPVMWVVGRQDSLATVCSMGALVVWPSGGSRHGGPQAALAGLLLALALLCKEPYVVVAVLLFARTVIDRIPWRKRWAWLAWPVAGIVATVVLRHSLGIPSTAGSAGTLATAMVSYATIVWHYLSQLATIENGATIVSYRPLSWPAALGVYLGFAAASIPLLRAAWLGSRRASLVSFGLLWFLVALAPHVVSLPVFAVYANRYAYFPLMGLLVAAAAAAEAMEDHVRPAIRHIASLALSLVIVLAGLRTADEARSWQDALTIFSHKLDPEDGMALDQHASIRLQREGCGSVLPELARVVELVPALGRPWHNLAGCLLSTGRYHAAVDAAGRALALEPGKAGAEYNFGAALVFTGQTQQGITHLERAARLDPGHVLTARLLASLRAQVAAEPGTDSPR